jgi:hypothetical protein
MRKPSKPKRLMILELDEEQGLLDAESKEILSNLRSEYEAACYDWADAVNDYERDEALTERSGNK